MAKWQRKLDIKDVWDSNNVQLIAKTISERLSSLTPFGHDDLDHEREDLAAQFSSLASDDAAETDEFDSVMTELYDWADQSIDGHWNGKKVCWVAKF